MKEDELFPWSKEGKITRMGGLADIKTSQKARVGSKPKTKGAEYLNVYMLLKEKERLESFGEVTGKTQAQAIEHWEETVRVLERAKENLPLEANSKGRKKKEEKREREVKVPANFKKMAIDY